MTIDDKVAQSIRCFCVSYETGKHSRLALLQRARRRRMVGAREDGDPEKEDGRKATNNDRQNNKCGSEVGTVGGPRGRGGGRRHAMRTLGGDGVSIWGSTERRDVRVAQKEDKQREGSSFAQGAMFGRALQNAVGGCSWVLQNRRDTRTTMEGSSVSIVA